MNDPFRDVAVSDNGGCAVTQSGVLSCWGSHAPDKFPPPADFRPVQLSGDGRIMCGVDQSKAVKCWGEAIANNVFGITSALPQADTVSVADHHICIKTLDGYGKCFGSNYQSQLIIPENVKIRQIVAGANRNDFWGTPNYKEYGFSCWIEEESKRVGCIGGTAFPEIVIGPLREGLTAEALSANGNIVCAVTNTAGSVECFGNKSNFNFPTDALSLFVPEE